MKVHKSLIKFDDTNLNSLIDKNKPLYACWRYSVLDFRETYM